MKKPKKEIVVKLNKLVKIVKSNDSKPSKLK